MISLWIILALLVTHFIADFFIQTEHQALNKSKNLEPLARHCATYAICFLPFGFTFAVITGLLHGLVDYNTSRMAGKYWQAGESRKFFQVIGFDQLLHGVCLVSLYFILA
ncbi:TMhelix containing protein [Vibrio phage 1.081.O._10N.286.52.C2]|nr:TMhelix containing protein [Vibrio phage 1.081.O._10N.286.52.C2]